METFAKSKEEFLTTFLDLKNGIPSDDTFNRVFSAIDNDALEKYFIKWVSHLVDITDGEIILINGKTIRRAKSKGTKSLFHMVSAWASRNSMVLGQVKVAKKSNKIMAIPELLDLIAIKGCTVTIDAMGCQKEIASKIITKEANYILAVKENQKQLYQNIEDEFKFSKHTQVDIHQDLGHGRIEVRKCNVISDFQFIENQDGWENLTSIIKRESIREFKNSTRITETATKYCISSLKEEAQIFQKNIRLHWTIKNSLHWVLDVAFSENTSRKRIGNAA